MKTDASDHIVLQDIAYVLGCCKAEFELLAGKSILLTGGSGFVGSYLVESVMAYNATNPGQRCNLFLPTRSKQRAEAKFPHLFNVPSLHWFEWDAKAEIVLVDDIDYVIHAASPVDPAEYRADAAYSAMQEMIQTTDAVIRFSKEKSISRFLFISSGAVYGSQPTDMSAIPESYDGGPALADSVSAYGEGKRYCEMLCNLSGLPIVTARLFSFLGPNLDLNGSFAIADFIQSADQEGEISLHSDGSSIRTWCYASDMVVMIWKLLLSGKIGDAYNVGQDKPDMTILELANRVASLLSATVTVENTSSIDKIRSRYVPNIDKVRKFYAPTIDFETALQRTIHSMFCQGRVSTPLSPLVGGSCESL